MLSRDANYITGPAHCQGVFKVTHDDLPALSGVSLRVFGDLPALSGVSLRVFGDLPALSGVSPRVLGVSSRKTRSTLGQQSPVVIDLSC